MTRIVNLRRYFCQIFRSLAFPTSRSGTIDLRYLQSLIGKDAKIIIEIGANDGSHTFEFLRLFPKARIYAFEPDPRALSKFKLRIADHPSDTLSELAIGAQD